MQIDALQRFESIFRGGSDRTASRSTRTLWLRAILESIRQNATIGFQINIFYIDNHRQSGSNDPMLPKTRQRYYSILAAVAKQPTILNKAIAEQLACSESSVNRDLAELRKLKWLRLTVDYAAAFDLRERISLALQAAPRTQAKQYGYSEREGLARFLISCLEHKEFAHFRRRVAIESVDSVTGRDADLIMTFLADAADTWHSFTNQVARLPGVTRTETRVIFRNST